MRPHVRVVSGAHTLPEESWIKRSNSPLRFWSQWAATSGTDAFQGPSVEDSPTATARRPGSGRKSAAPAARSVALRILGDMRVDPGRDAHVGVAKQLAHDLHRRSSVIRSGSSSRRIHHEAVLSVATCLWTLPAMAETSETACATVPPLGDLDENRTCVLY